MTNKAKALVEECRLDAKAFRENTVYDSDGDPIRLIANADRLDQYADRIEALEAEVERLVADNEQWQVDYNEVVFEKLELLAVLGEMTPDYEMLVDQSWDDGAIWSWVEKAKGIAAKARAALGEKQ